MVVKNKERTSADISICECFYLRNFGINFALKIKY